MAKTRKQEGQREYKQDKSQKKIINKRDKDNK